MIKYLNTAVTFKEVPNETSLCINITNCPNHCEGCHSPELREDIGEELTDDVLRELINTNDGITCVCFMGGDNDLDRVNELAEFIREWFPKIKVALYSGLNDILDITKEINSANFDYIKYGSYQEDKGGLDNPNTNQVFSKVVVNDFLVEEQRFPIYSYINLNELFQK